MRFVAVTACPTGIAHTLMAAEALKRQAELMGHQIDVETQGAEGTQDPLDPDAIARADAVSSRPTSTSTRRGLPASRSRRRPPPTRFATPTT